MKSAYRKLQHAVLTDLDHFLDYEIGMLTTVLVGSSNTNAFEGYMVTFATQFCAVCDSK